VSPIGGGSPTTHWRWERKPVRFDQGIGGRGRNVPQVEQAGHAPAGGVAGYASSVFAQALVVLCPLHHGPEPRPNEFEHAVGKQLLAWPVND
jgi:hypothetical protein